MGEMKIQLLDCPPEYQHREIEKRINELKT